MVLCGIGVEGEGIAGGGVGLVCAASVGHFPLLEGIAVSGSGGKDDLIVAAEGSAGGGECLPIHSRTHGTVGIVSSISDDALLRHYSGGHGDGGGLLNGEVELAVHRSDSLRAVLRFQGHFCDGIAGFGLHIHIDDGLLFHLVAAVDFHIAQMDGFDADLILVVVYGQRYIGLGRGNDCLVGPDALTVLTVGGDHEGIFRVAVQSCHGVLKGTAVERLLIDLPECVLVLAPDIDIVAQHSQTSRDPRITPGEVDGIQTLQLCCQIVHCRRRCGNVGYIVGNDERIFARDAQINGVPGQVPGKAVGLGDIFGDAVFLQQVLPVQVLHRAAGLGLAGGGGGGTIGVHILQAGIGAGLGTIAKNLEACHDAHFKGETTLALNAFGGSTAVGFGTLGLAAVVAQLILGRTDLIQIAGIAPGVALLAQITPLAVDLHHRGEFLPLGLFFHQGVVLVHKGVVVHHGHLYVGRSLGHGDGKTHTGFRRLQIIPRPAALVLVVKLVGVGDDRGALEHHAVVGLGGKAVGGGGGQGLLKGLGPGVRGTGLQFHRGNVCLHLSRKAHAEGGFVAGARGILIALGEGIGGLAGVAAQINAVKIRGHLEHSCYLRVGIGPVLALVAGQHAIVVPVHGEQHEVGVVIPVALGAGATLSIVAANEEAAGLCVEHAGVGASGTAHAAAFAVIILAAHGAQTVEIVVFVALSIGIDKEDLLIAVVVAVEIAHRHRGDEGLVAHGALNGIVIVLDKRDGVEFPCPAGGEVNDLAAHKDVFRIDVAVKRHAGKAQGRAAVLTAGAAGKPAGGGDGVKPGDAVIRAGGGKAAVGPGIEDSDVPGLAVQRIGSPCIGRVGF